MGSEEVLLFQVGAIRNTKWPPGPGCSKQWIKLSTGQIWFILDNFCPLDKCGCSKVIHWTNMRYPGQLCPV
jgi:hypothetical protein